MQESKCKCMVILRDLPALVPWFFVGTLMTSLIHEHPAMSQETCRSLLRDVPPQRVQWKCIDPRSWANSSRKHSEFAQNFPP